MTGYTETILKYAADETHIGLLDNPDGTGEVGLSGQEVGKRLAVRFTLNIAAEQVKEIRFQVFGCGFTIAACAAAAELSEGRALTEVRNYSPETIEQQLGGLPKERDYCAELAHQALQAAVSSACKGAEPVQAEMAVLHEEDHDARVSPEDPLFCSLMTCPTPLGFETAEQAMFAGLLTVASQEECSLTAALGIESAVLEEILTTYFPMFDSALLEEARQKTGPPPEINPEVLAILMSHAPVDVTGGKQQTAEWLARIIAARAAQPGHLWTAMGFFERPELSAAIRRHLPTLAAANSKGMRWKRYLFKQVCDLNGGVMCKSPNCGDCSDYALCFAPDDE